MARAQGVRAVRFKFNAQIELRPTVLCTVPGYRKDQAFAERRPVVMDLLDTRIPAAPEESFQVLPNRRPQLNRVELNRVERDQRLD